MSETCLGAPIGASSTFQSISFLTICTVSLHFCTDITTLQTIDWNAMVSLNDLETSWKEETKDSETPIDANNVAVVANEKGTETPKKSSPDSATTVTPNHGKVGTNDEKERIESSDAFRIRDGGEVLPSAKLETEKSVDSANLVSPGSQASPRLASDNISDLMNNVCVIFQSTSKLHSSDAASGAHPFITLQPSYLRAQNGADVLSRLDEIMNQAIRKSSFSSNPDSASWKDVVKKAFEQSGNETATIPLYMILLLRMKLSIFESFQQCTADAAQKKASDGATEQEATSISGLSPMSEVLSRLGSISEMDAAQLRDISASSALSDFVKATQKGGHDLMFPLLTILQKVKSSSLSFDDTLASIDRAVAQVIERFNKKSSEDSTENNQAETDVSNENPKNNQDASSSTEKADGKATEAMKQTDQAAPQTANGKKKKKKKKVRAIVLVVVETNERRLLTSHLNRNEREAAMVKVKDLRLISKRQLDNNRALERVHVKATKYLRPTANLRKER
jgi:hypothetical protein